MTDVPRSAEAEEKLIADLERAYEWIREPDWAENFSRDRLYEWLDERPCRTIFNAISALRELEIAVDEEKAHVDLLERLLSFERQRREYAEKELAKLRESTALPL